MPEEGSLSRTVTLSGPLRTRRPRRRAAAWDERPRSRVRLTGGGGPCGADSPARHVPPASTCDGESRAAWPSSGCSAGRCASLTSSSTGDCRVTLGHPGASRVRSMYLDARDEPWRTSAPCTAVRARKTGGLAGCQGRGRLGQRQRALWIPLFRGLGRPVVASASRRGGNGSRPHGVAGHHGTLRRTERHGMGFDWAPCHDYPQVWTGLWTCPSIRRQRPR